MIQNVRVSYSQTDRQASLRVRVDQENSLPHPYKADTQIDRRSRFTDSALLIRDSDDFAIGQWHTPPFLSSFSTWSGVSFVLDPDTPWELTRRLPAGRSIGLSPPRLLYGRAANYGSIIISCACHGLRRRQSGFSCFGILARPSGVLAYLQPWLKVSLKRRERIWWLYVQFSRFSGEKSLHIGIAEN